MESKIALPKWINNTWKICWKKIASTILQFLQVITLCVKSILMLKDWWLIMIRMVIVEQTPISSFKFLASFKLMATIIDKSLVSLLVRLLYSFICIPWYTLITSIVLNRTNILNTMSKLLLPVITQWSLIFIQKSLKNSWSIMKI